MGYLEGGKTEEMGRLPKDWCFFLFPKQDIGHSRDSLLLGVIGVSYDFVKVVLVYFYRNGNA